jgi:hypothetical protein
MPLVAFGTFVLIFGFFGFNGGSVLSLGSELDTALMSLAIVNTVMAAAGGGAAAGIVYKVRGCRRSNSDLETRFLLTGFTCARLLHVARKVRACVCVWRVWRELVILGPNVRSAESVGSHDQSCVRMLARPMAALRHFTSRLHVTRVR